MTEQDLKKFLLLKTKIKELEDYINNKTQSITSQLKKDKVAQNEVRKPVENEVINKLSKEMELEQLIKERDKLQKEIFAFINTLNNQLHRKIIILKYVVGYNTLEIAGTLKLSTKTVANNLSGIRKKYLKK